MNKFTTTIEFSSRKELAAQLGMNYDSKLNERIEDSIIYLSKLRVRYQQWRLAKKNTITKTLKPAIKRFELHRRKVHLEFDEQWIHLYREKGGFYHSVPLPFPTTPSMQNMYLIAFSQIDPKKPLTFSVPDFRKRTGFDKTTHAAVRQVLNRLSDYIWANRGGRLVFDVYYDETKNRDMVKLELTLPVKGLSGVTRTPREKLDEPIYYRDVIRRLGIERHMWRFVNTDQLFPKEIKPQEWRLLDILKYRDRQLPRRLDQYEEWLMLQE